MTVPLVTELVDDARINFQAGEVRKPLLAVSSVNSKGNGVWFDGLYSYIIPPGPTLEQIRAVLREPVKKIPLHMKNGIFVMKAWKPKAPTFPRQGA